MTTTERPVTAAGLVHIPIGKRCLLLLTEAEYQRALKRGKWLRRQQALARRMADPIPGQRPTGERNT